MHDFRVLEIATLPRCAIFAKLAISYLVFLLLLVTEELKVALKLASLASHAGHAFFVTELVGWRLAVRRGS